MGEGARYEPLGSCATERPREQRGPVIDREADNARRFPTEPGGESENPRDTKAAECAFKFEKAFLW